MKNSKGQAIGGNTRAKGTGSLTKTAEDITLTAKSGITFIYGGRTIVLYYSGIIIKGKGIHVNP